MDLDAVGDHECGIEADAELPDQLAVLLRIAGQAREKLRSAGFRDRAEMLRGLVARHADAGIGHRQRARRRIEIDTDLRARACRQRRLRERGEPQPVAGIRGVRDEFAQEYLPMAVHRMDDQPQQAADFGLECAGFGGVFGHRRLLGSGSPHGGTNGGFQARGECPRDQRRRGILAAGKRPRRWRRTDTRSSISSISCASLSIGYAAL